MLRETAGRPVKTLKHMKKFSGEVVKIVTNKSDLAPDPKDKRFLDPAFRMNPFYKAGMQYYLAVREGVAEWMDDLDFDEAVLRTGRWLGQLGAGPTAQPQGASPGPGESR